MTPADLAKHSAISFEAKKDSLRQMQNGDWKVAFTVQGVDMDERITRAAMGTRFIAVLVEIDEQELPITPAEKESSKALATPQLAAPDKSQPVGAKRMEWRELQPAAQAGIRCADPVFWKFLEEQDGCECSNADEAASIVRFLCCVESRSELSTDHRKRVIWHQLDEQFQAWKLIDA